MANERPDLRARAVEQRERRDAQSSRRMRRQPSAVVPVSTTCRLFGIGHGAPPLGATWAMTMASQRPSSRRSPAMRVGAAGPLTGTGASPASQASRRSSR